MPGTLTRAEHEHPVLTPPEDPSRPPQRPAEGDRHLALLWIAGDRTAASTAAYFARSDALRSVLPDEGTAQSAMAVMLAGLAAETAARHARLVSAMAELEAAEWTPETARAALGLPAAEPRGAAAA